MNSGFGRPVPHIRWCAVALGKSFQRMPMAAVRTVRGRRSSWIPVSWKWNLPASKSTSNLFSAHEFLEFQRILTERGIGIGGIFVL